MQGRILPPDITVRLLSPGTTVRTILNFSLEQECHFFRTKTCDVQTIQTTRLILRESSSSHTTCTAET